jgi:hypothetical protein
MSGHAAAGCRACSTSGIVTPVPPNNRMAAMPSLHEAFPVLSALYLRKTFGRWGLLMLGHAAIVWFAVVYMAEHWISDEAASVALTVLACALVEGVAAWRHACTGARRRRPWQRR